MHSEHRGVKKICMDYPQEVIINRQSMESKSLSRKGSYREKIRNKYCGPSMKRQEVIALSNAMVASRILPFVRPREIFGHVLASNLREPPLDI
jgi:hypothetical protein